MRIGVMSDSHDHLDNIDKAIHFFNAEKVDLVLHCGDFVAPFAVKPLAQLTMKIVACYGNNDGELVGLQKTFDNLKIEVYKRNYVFTWNSKRLLMMHEPDQPDIFAASGQFDLVCYGHTHNADIHRIDNVLVVNPGEVCGWLTRKPTVALVDLVGNTAVIHSL